MSTGVPATTVLLRESLHSTQATLEDLCVHKLQLGTLQSTDSALLVGVDKLSVSDVTSQVIGDPQAANPSDRDPSDRCCW